jgi:Flp pilus assembly protein TadD
METTVSCKADVVLGFTGQPDGLSNSSVVPFGHYAVVAVTPRDSDALAINTLARSLAKLFGAGTGTQTIADTDAPEADGFNPMTVELIGALRKYDFARGTAALTGTWKKPVEAALTRCFQGLYPNPVARVHTTLGRALADERKHEAAAAQFRRAVEATPSDPALRFEYAMALNTNHQSNEAVEQLREVARLDPLDARPHAAIGAIYVNSKRVDEAIDELRIATRLEPGNEGYHAVLGGALASQMGRAVEAIEAYQTALRLRPNASDAIRGLSKLDGEQYASAQRVIEAEAEVRRAPDSALAYLWLGLAYARASRNDEAGVAFRKSIALDPKSGLGHLALARWYYLRGEYQAADQEANAAKALGSAPTGDLVNALNRRLGRK